MSYLRVRFWWFARRWSEKTVMAIAWRLPRKLVMWCAIRLMAHATQGPYSNTEVGSLSAVEALQRWDRSR